MLVITVVPTVCFLGWCFCSAESQRFELTPLNFSHFTVTGQLSQVSPLSSSYRQGAVRHSAPGHTLMVYILLQDARGSKLIFPLATEETCISILRLNLLPAQILVLQNQGMIIQHLEMPYAAEQSLNWFSVKLLGSSQYWLNIIALLKMEIEIKSLPINPVTNTLRMINYDRGW